MNSETLNDDKYTNVNFFLYFFTEIPCELCKIPEEKRIVKKFHNWGKKPFLLLKKYIIYAPLPEERSIQTVPSRKTWFIGCVDILNGCIFIMWCYMYKTCSEI